MDRLPTKTTKKSATAAKLNDPSIATQPINGGTAQENFQQQYSKLYGA